MNERDAAEFLGVKPGTLSVWRCTRRVDIPYVKLGRRVVYRRDDLEKYMRTQTVGADVNVD